MTSSQTTTRTYPVPIRVSSKTPLKITDNPVFDRSCQYAAGGQVKGYQLPILAAGPWREGAEWAQSILDREARAADAKRETLLASIGYNDSYNYHGVLDSNIDDHEVIVGLVRADSGSGPLEYWDGLDWGQIEFNQDESVNFVILDPDLLAAVVDSFQLGIGGVTLSPFHPKAWVPGESEAVEDFFRHLNPQAGDYNVEVVGANDYGSCVIASLGPAQFIDYESVQRAVARWARRTDAMVAGAARDTFRDILVREGVRVDHDALLAFPPRIDTVWVERGNDVQEYSVGQPVVASGGVGADIVYAIVDEMDTSAVLDVIRVAPGPVAYKRSGGKWVKDQPTLLRLLGVDPPPVVELRANQVEEVIGQVDAFDQSHPVKSDKPAMTAASWMEAEHPREGGKFAKKQGFLPSANAAKKALKKTPPKKKRAGGIPSIYTGFNPEAGQRDEIVLKAINDVNKRLAAKDNEFDVKFAKEGLGESRRREIFDRQLRGLRERLVRAGVNSHGLALVVEAKLKGERNRRDDFERERKNRAEQERVRRMQNYWASINVPAAGPSHLGLTSDASHMPGNLKKYWVAGKGAAKIRWNTSGDYNRCRRALAKYLAPEQVDGACASLHHVATGQWPGKGRHH